MRIICSKDEFAKLVRECMAAEIEGACRGCIFGGVCSKGDPLGDGDWMTGIEDVCNIGEDSNG